MAPRNEKTCRFIGNLPNRMNHPATQMPKVLMETSAVIESLVGRPARSGSWLEGLEGLRAERQTRRAIAVLTIGSLGAVLMLVLFCAVLGVRPVNTAFVIARSGFFLAAAVLLHRFRLRIARDVAMTFGILLFGAFLHPAIEHLGLRFGYALISPALARTDAALGLDWFAYHDWVRSMTALRWASLAAYNSFGWQLVIVPCLLAAFGASPRLFNFFAAMAAVLLAVDLVFLLWPADNAVTFLGASDPVPLSWSRDMAHAIAARVPSYDVTLDRTGLISFPSFHTAGALIVLWSLRRTMLFWPAFALEALLLLGVPAWGAHFFVDMAGGATVAILAIMLVEWPAFTTAQLRWRSAPAR
jgi:hypothetical protein